MYYIIKNNIEVVIYNKSMLYIMKLRDKLQREDKKNTYEIEKREA